MAAQANGRISSSADGLLKGHLDSKLSARRAPTGKFRGFMSRATSLSLKLLVWYTIMTIFRCPSDPADLTRESPALCRPYLDTKAHLTPYVRPYYEKHVARHVEKVQPYYDQAKTTVYDPAASFAVSQYKSRAAPIISRAGHAALHEAKAIGSPYLESATQWASRRLAPYESTIEHIRLSSWDLYELEIRPFYRRTAPFVAKSYRKFEHFVIYTLYPQTQAAVLASHEFVVRRAWPTVRVIYGQSIEPQILRITQRLASYYDNKKLHAAFTPTSSFASVRSATSAMSSSATELSSSATSVFSSVTSTVSEEPPVSDATQADTIQLDVPTEASTPVVEPTSTSSVAGDDPPAPAPVEEVSQDPELPPAAMLERDLSKWEEQMANAVKAGAASVDQRIVAILGEQKAAQIDGVAKAMLLQLDELSASLEKSLRNKIVATVQDLPADTSSEHIADVMSKLTNRIRLAGQKVKAKVQDIRDWRVKAADDLAALLTTTLEETEETISNIRDLRLQEIGRRWASSEDISHSDWARYNRLKRSNSWRQDIDTTTRKSDALASFRADADVVIELALRQAEDIAARLGRLRDSAKHKLDTRDTSDNFDSPDDGILRGDSQQVLEAPEVALSAVDDLTGTARPDVSPSSVFEKATDSASQVVEDISAGTVPSAASAASELLESPISALYTAVVDGDDDGTRTDTVTRKVSRADAESGTPAGSSFEAAVDDESSSMVDRVESATGSAKSLGSRIISSLTSSSKTRVPGGAMAQEVPNHQPIIDDIIEVEPIPDDSNSAGVLSMVNNVADNARSLTQAVQDALKSSPTLQGSVESVTSVASKRMADAMSAASSVLYGVETPGLLPTYLSGQYDAAVSAASEALYGPATPLAASIASEISSSFVAVTSQAGEQGHDLANYAISRYSHALAIASSYSSMAASRVSAQIQGSPGPIQEQMLSSVRSAYANSRAIATRNLQKALGSSQSTQGAYESIASMASSRLSEGLAAASSKFDSARSSAAIETESAQPHYLAQAQAAYYQGIGLAHEQYSSFVSAASLAVSAASTRASGAVYGSATPVYRSLFSVAQDKYSSAAAAASAQLEQATNAAKSGVGAATPDDSILVSASASYSSVVSAASVALYGSKAPVYESILSQASSRFSELSVAAGASADSALSAVRSFTEETASPGVEAVANGASDQYSRALDAASSALVSASSYASAAMYGTSTGAFESAASALQKAMARVEPTATEAIMSRASANWEALLAQASRQVYGSQIPLTATVASRASVYMSRATSAASEQLSQATSLAVDQHAAVAALLSQVMSGQGPEYTGSVMARLQSVFHTGAPSAVSDASSQASSAYSVASSALFTAPAHVESIIDNAKAKMDSVIRAASAQYHATSPKPLYEEATSVIAESLGSVSSAVSSAIYGTPAEFAQAAQATIAEAADSAQRAVSEAIFGVGPTGIAGSVSSAAEAAYSGAHDAAGKAAAAASSVVYGPEQGALESAGARLADYMESARLKLSEYGQTLEAVASEGVASVSSAVSGAGSAASSVASSIASSVGSQVRDEL